MAWIDLGAIMTHMDLDLRGWKRGMDKVRNDSTRLQSFMRDNAGAFRAVGGAMTAAGTAIAGASTAFVSVAMDAQETENLFVESMGNMTDAARRWVENMHDDLGLARSEVKQSVSTFNVMFRSMGLGTQRAYDMATGLTQLAYDMQSFYNIASNERAFEVLRSGIMGEIEPVRRFGIVLNATAVEAWALTNGLIEQGQELTEQQKVWARYNMLLDQTKAAQGDLARTSDSLTNQWRRLKNTFRDTAATLGTMLIPEATELVSTVNSVVETVSDWAEENPELASTILKVTAVMGGLMLVLGPLAMALPSIVSGLGMMATVLTGPWGLAIAGAAVAAGLVAKSIADAAEENRRLRTEIGEGVSELESLEERYEALSEKQNRTTQEQEELETVTERMKKLYADFGREIEKTDEAFGSLFETIRDEQRLEWDRRVLMYTQNVSSLRMKIEELRKAAEPRRGVGDQVAPWAPSEVAEARNELEELQPRLERQERLLENARRELNLLNSAYDDTSDKVNDVGGSIRDNTPWIEKFSESLLTSQQARDRIEALKRFRETLDEGTVEWKKTTEEIERYREMLGGAVDETVQAAEEIGDISLSFRTPFEVPEFAQRASRMADAWQQSFEIDEGPVYAPLIRGWNVLMETMADDRRSVTSMWTNSFDDFFRGLTASWGGVVDSIGSLLDNMLNDVLRQFSYRLSQMLAETAWEQSGFEGLFRDILSLGAGAVGAASGGGVGPTDTFATWEDRSTPFGGEDTFGGFEGGFGKAARGGIEAPAIDFRMPEVETPRVELAERRIEEPPPVITLNVQNNTRTPINARQVSSDVTGREAVIGVVLEEVETNPAFARRMRGR